MSTSSDSLAWRMRSIFSCSLSFQMVTVPRTFTMSSGSNMPMEGP